MKYDFDTGADRKGTHCIKWDYLREFFGMNDLNALWVADMDFKAPPEVVKAIVLRAEHGVFGYTAKHEDFFMAVIDWFRTRYGWHIEKDWIVATPGVVPALNIALNTFTGEGDGVIIQPPVYFPFRESVELNRRVLLNNQLVLSDGVYRMDLDDLERKAARAKMLVLCSPHNPVSRVWTEDELRAVDDICRRNDLFVFSDEIHADIVFSPHRHVPTALAGSYCGERSISAYATSKTFNLAGLQLSVNIIPDKAIRDRFRLSLQELHLGMSNIFGITGTTAAYRHGLDWLEQLLEYLWGNYQTVDDMLHRDVPGIRTLKPEGTFLLWLDCRDLRLSDEELSSLFICKAGLALSEGVMFGPGGSGFMRLNTACPRKNLVRAMEALGEAVRDTGPIPPLPGSACLTGDD